MNNCPGNDEVDRIVIFFFIKIKFFDFLPIFRTSDFQKKFHDPLFYIRYLCWILGQTHKVYSLMPDIIKRANHLECFLVTRVIREQKAIWLFCSVIPIHLLPFIRNGAMIPFPNRLEE